MLMHLSREYNINGWTPATISSVFALPGIDLNAPMADGSSVFMSHKPVSDSTCNLIYLFVSAGASIRNLDNRGTSLMHVLAASLTYPLSMNMHSLIGICHDAGLSFANENDDGRNSFEFALQHSADAESLHLIQIWQQLYQWGGLFGSEEIEALERTVAAMMS
jgi:hypothetical protein